MQNYTSTWKKESMFVVMHDVHVAHCIKSVIRVSNTYIIFQTLRNEQIHLIDGSVLFEQVLIV